MTQNKTKLTVALWIAAFSFVLLTSAAYAWMSMAGDIRVTDLALNVVTDNALELAPDAGGTAGEWTTVIRMPDLLGGDAVLRPVAYSSKREAFLAPRYGLDGRPDFSTPKLVAPLSANAAAAPPSSGEAGGEAGAAEPSGYLFSFDFWIRAGSSDCSVRLSEPKEVSKGLDGGGSYVIGRPVWNPRSVSHDDGGRGAQNALRIAFRTYSDYGGDGGGFVIYEPNADGGGAYAPTPSIDGTGALTDEGSLILQSSSGWAEQDPVLRDNVDYKIGGFITEDTELFTLAAGKARRVTLYVWLEGQDADCVNAISGAQLIINLQFSGVPGEYGQGGSGGIVAR